MINQNKPADRDRAQLKASILTLGCKVNQTESEALAQLLASEGYRIVEESAEPDIVIINTCTVTGTASSKSRKLMRRMTKEHPLSIIAVMGCYTQTNPGETAEIEGVDLILGTQDRASVVKHLKKLADQGLIKKESSSISGVREFSGTSVYEELPLISSESRVRAMLKIQDGCSQFCTYCIVPYARGPSRSRRPEKVLEEAEKLVAAGHKELVLTGIHTGAYGQDRQDGIDLSILISHLAKAPGLKRLRISSVEPMEFTPALIDVLSSVKTVCPHFHIPLQSGSDYILGKMNRPYSTKNYADLLKDIRNKIPEAAITTDVMAGFPGETEREHQESLQFIESCSFAGIHAFPYSLRPGTAAAGMPGQVPKAVKSARVQEIIHLGEKSRRDYLKLFIGRTLEVLLEKVERDGSAQGHTPNYLDIKIPGSINPGYWKAGDLVECLIREDYIVF